jgi:hypothetical protein
LNAKERAQKAQLKAWIECLVIDAENGSAVAADRLRELWVTRMEAAGLIQDADEFGWYRYCPPVSSSSSNGNPTNGAA